MEPLKMRLGEIRQLTFTEIRFYIGALKERADHEKAEMERANAEGGHSGAATGNHGGHDPMRDAAMKAILNSGNGGTW